VATVAAMREARDAIRDNWGELLSFGAEWERTAAAIAKPLRRAKEAVSALIRGTPPTDRLDCLATVDWVHMR
jgi:hypothetical protein